MRKELLEFPRKAAKAEVELGRGGRDCRLLLHENDHQRRHRAGDEGKKENGPQVDVEQAEQCDGEQRSERGAEVVADPLEAEGLPAVSLVGGRCDERIAWSGTRARSQSIERPRRESTRPGRGEPDERLRDGGDEIPCERDRLPTLEPIGEPSGESLREVLYRLSDSLDEAHDADARPQRLREEDRQDGVQHLRRGVGE
jgi:hypothetical protein